MYQKAIDLLDDYAAKKKTRPNKEGSTEGERRVKTNEQSRTQDQEPVYFPKNSPELAEQLQRIKAQREETELQVKLQEEISKETKAWLEAGGKLR